MKRNVRKPISRLDRRLNRIKQREYEARKKKEEDELKDKEAKEALENTDK